MALTASTGPDILDATDTNCCDRAEGLIAVASLERVNSTGEWDWLGATLTTMLAVSLTVPV